MSQQKIYGRYFAGKRVLWRVLLKNTSDIYHTTVSVKIDKKLNGVREMSFNSFSGIFTQKTNFKTFGFPTYGLWFIL